MHCLGGLLMAATNRETDALLKVARGRTRVAKADVDARKAEIIAEAEAALSRQFEEQDAAFADLMADAREYMAEVKAKLDARCEELGIPAGFRPGTELYWFSRGANADPKRRAELRKTIATRADALAKRAKLEIERQSVAVQEQLIEGTFASEESRELLAKIPAPEALMPAIELPELEAGR